MSAFVYTAIDPSGKKRTGTIVAGNSADAKTEVESTGSFVLDLKEQADGAGSGGSTRIKATRSDIALFTRRLADLAGAGVPLDRTLSVIAEQSDSSSLKSVAEGALHEVRGGKPVSEALSAYPRLFPEAYTETLRAGEASGHFSDVCSRLAGLQESEVSRRSQITSALIYPAVLASTAVFVVGFIMVFVLPRLGPVFENLGTELPMPTHVLLETSSFLQKNGLEVVFGIIVAIALFIGFFRRPEGKRSVEQILIRTPIAGIIFFRASVSRFARLLGTLLSGGVPVLESLELAGNASGSFFVKAKVDTVRDAVRQGQTLGQALKDAGAFPPVLIQMVSIGEETGNLPEMLEKVCNSLDFEVDNSLRRAVSLVEPAIVLIMGSFVGFIVLSVLLPIYSAQNLVK